MSTTWLKLIGTTKRPCPESYKRDHVDFPTQPRRVRRGDSMVLYAVGRNKRVFALAEVTSDVYPSGIPDWPYRVNISYTLNLDVSLGVSIDEVSTPERDLLRSILRRSYIKLRPKEYERAETKLRQAVSKG